ncbi:MAG: DUF2723 domain-containing protein [Bacteroidota bacterium]|jgi:hypothetical protein
MKNLRTQLSPWLPTLAVVAVFIVYLKTLLPGVGYSGDTSKFQFVGKVLGTPHEPGSPTYVMLNYVFVSLFPIGTTGFKANLLSTIFSAAALFVLSRTLLLLGVRRSLSAAVVLIFGFTYTLWSQSVIAEVYTLNVLFVALTIHFFLRWHLLGNHGDFLVACAVYAFSFGDHLIVVTLLPAITYFVWKTRKEFFWNPRVIVEVLFIIALGAAQYGYLFWRYYSHETSYLEIAVPDLKTLWYYVSGGQFHSYFFVAGFKGVFFLNSPLVARLLWLEYLFLLPVCVLGFAVIQNGRIRNFLLLSALTTLLFALAYTISDIFVYLLPVYVVLAITLGIGLEWIVDRFPKGYAVYLGAVVACLPVFFLVTNFARADQSKNTKAKMLVEESLRIVVRKALIICPDYDYAEHFWYYLFAERGEQDSLYALFSHEEDLPLHDLKLYIRDQRPFYLPLQRRTTPPGLTVYYCSAYEPPAFDRSRTRYPMSRDMLNEYRRTFVFQPMKSMGEVGFRFVNVGESLYRVDKPLE